MQIGKHITVLGRYHFSSSHFGIAVVVHVFSMSKLVKEPAFNCPSMRWVLCSLPCCLRHLRSSRLRPRCYHNRPRDPTWQTHSQTKEIPSFQIQKCPVGRNRRAGLAYTPSSFIPLVGKGWKRMEKDGKGHTCPN